MVFDVGLSWPGCDFFKCFCLQVTKHGLLLTFLSFSGQVDFLHMEPEELSTYIVGQEVQMSGMLIINSAYSVKTDFLHNASSSTTPSVD